MKLLILLALCAFAAASFEVEKVQFVDSPVLAEDSKVQVVDEPAIPVDVLNEVSSSADEESSAARNFLLNTLIRQLIAFVRRIINNGSEAFGIPPLDPLFISSYHLSIPAGLVNLELDLFNVEASGIGSFVVHKSNLQPKKMTFDIDISVPLVKVSAGNYFLDGNFFTAIPLFGKGDSHFEIEGLRIRGLIHLKQSEDGQSVIIDSIENPSFEVPKLKSLMSGVIGGGDIDQIVNLMIEEVIVGYINSFQGAISKFASEILVGVANPVLEQLNTWSYLKPFV